MRLVRIEARPFSFMAVKSSHTEIDIARCLSMRRALSPHRNKQKLICRVAVNPWDILSCGLQLRQPHSQRPRLKQYEGKDLLYKTSIDCLDYTGNETGYKRALVSQEVSVWLHVSRATAKWSLSLRSPEVRRWLSRSNWNHINAQLLLNTMKAASRSHCVTHSGFPFSDSLNIWRRFILRPRTLWIPFWAYYKWIESWLAIIGF